MITKNSIQFNKIIKRSTLIVSKGVKVFVLHGMLEVLSGDLFQIFTMSRVNHVFEVSMFDQNTYS